MFSLVAIYGTTVPVVKVVNVIVLVFDQFMGTFYCILI